MTKMEFLQQLYNHLSGFSASERDEIIQDFEEHFSAGTELGKSEEQICEELGTPYSCAMQYMNQAQANSPKQTAEKPSAPHQTPSYTASNTAPVYDARNRFLWRLLFIFFVMCAFGIYPTATAMILSPIGIAIAAIFAVAIVPSGAMIGFLVSLSIAIAAAGLILFAAMTWLLKLSFRKAEI